MNLPYHAHMRRFENNFEIKKKHKLHNNTTNWFSKHILNIDQWLDQCETIYSNVLRKKKAPESVDTRSFVMKFKRR